ncbi:MAG: AAA family ATPase [Candidatus Omnitrophica bacterium]|nr:AAA family ATPase [Candidatus Omnitrophota bacterium]
MYRNFYGLKEKPFNVTSDPAFLFLSRTHKEALDHLLYGIKERKGFITITGEIGAGKTTICRALLNKCDENTRTAFIFNPTLSGTQLLEAILEDFGIAPERKNKVILFKQLSSFLLNELAKGHNVVLIVDEAQNMRSNLLEELRMLSNLETAKEKLFQIILVGQPELAVKLDTPALTQLRQRIAVRFHVTPLGRDETAKYICHRLAVAGAPDVVHFEEPALNAIYAYAKGIPRLINIVCDRALLHGYVQETKSITEGLIQKSIAEIEGTVLETVPAS